MAGDENVQFLFLLISSNRATFLRTVLYISLLALLIMLLMRYAYVIERTARTGTNESAISEACASGSRAFVAAVIRWKEINQERHGARQSQNSQG